MDADAVTSRDVLIVEDNPSVRSVMIRVLEQAGFSVDAVPDGLEALDMLAARRYRAVVCDVLMPFVNGKEFYEQLRAQAPDQAERVVFVTGTEELPYKRFLALSGRPVLRKPYDLREMIRVVAELVGRPPNPGSVPT
jgi:CheY-like chemotaxis protein